MVPSQTYRVQAKYREGGLLMLVIIVKDETVDLIGYNLYFDEATNKHSLWVRRPNGKTLKIAESFDREKVEILKQAMDYAVYNGDRVMNLQEGYNFIPQAQGAN